MIPISFLLLSKTTKEEVKNVLASQSKVIPCDIEKYLTKFNPSVSIYRVGSNIQKVAMPIEKDQIEYNQFINQLKGN